MSFGTYQSQPYGCPCMQMNTGKSCKKGEEQFAIKPIQTWYKNDQTPQARKEWNLINMFGPKLCKSSKVYGCQTTLSLNLLTITEPMRRPCSNSLWKQQWDSEHLLACKMAQLKGSRDLWATGWKFTNLSLGPDRSQSRDNPKEQTWCQTENDRLWLYDTVCDCYRVVFLVHFCTHHYTPENMS